LHLPDDVLFIIFKGFESYKDARNPRDHRVLQDKAGGIEYLWYHNHYGGTPLAGYPGK
jgi:hypothetical protein